MPKKHGRVRTGIERLATVPFESLIAALVVVSAVAGLFGIGDVQILDRELPTWLYVAISATYGLAGATMLVGIGTARGNVEAAGLVLLLSGVFVRFVGVGLAVGFTDERVILLLTLYVLTLAAGIARLRTILHQETLVRIGPP